MRLSRQMRAAGGRVVPHVDGVAIPAFVGRQAGSETGAWFKGKPLNQVLDMGVYRLATADPLGTTFQTVDGQGQNHLYANDRQWASDLNGYRDSRGIVRPEWAPVAMDDTSDRVAVSVKADNSLQVWDGAVLLMVEPTGPDLWEAPDIDYKDGVLAYRKNGKVKTWPERDIVHIPAAGVRYSRGYLCEYQDGRGVVVRPENSSRGIVVTEADSFGLDMRLQDDGTLVIVASAGKDERPEEFRRYVVNPVLATVNGERRAWVDLAVTVEMLPTAKRSTRPIGVGCFSEPGGFDLTGYDSRNRVDFLTTSKTRGVMVTLGTDTAEAIARSTARAIREGLPLYCYIDRKGLSPDDMPPFVGARRLAMLRNTIEAGESRDQANARLAQNLSDLRNAGIDVVGDIQLTAPAVWDVREVAARAIDFWNLCVDAGALAVWCFEWDRADGIRTQPLYQQVVAAMRAASADWTVFPSVSSAPVPAQTPAPVPKPQPSLEMLMAALTLKRSKFADGSYAADRGFKLYPLGNGNNMSIDVATGEPRPNGLPNNGPSESFLVKGDRAFVDFDRFGYSFLVVD